LRIKQIDVDTTWDRDDPILLNTVTLLNLVRDKIGDRDDLFAPCHHGIVEILDRVSRVVGAVIGRHKVCANSPRRDERTPCWRAAARMDNVDLSVKRNFR